MGHEPNIHIVGLGVSSRKDEVQPFSESALRALTSARLIIGSQRQLEILNHYGVKGYVDANKINAIEKKVLPKLALLKELIITCGHHEIVVLASGDPLFYGIGRWFSKHFPRDSIHYYTAVSSVQAACHAVGLSLQYVRVCSLHGRPVESLRSQFKRKRTLAILSDQHSQPLRLAEECKDAGFGLSKFWVCENMGSAQQQVRCFTVSDLLGNKNHQFDPLHITIIALEGEGGVQVEFPGIADERYSTGDKPGKGMITKREVRLAILSQLQPSNSDIIWDIGAGCGGLAVELSYWNKQVQVYAIEHNAVRRQHLEINQRQFGVVSNLHIIAGRAPNALAGLPLPNKIFIGGSDGELASILKESWRILPPNGICVASAVTKKSRAILEAFIANTNANSIEAVTIGVEKSSLQEGEWVPQVRQPVSVFKFKKEASACE